MASRMRFRVYVKLVFAAAVLLVGTGIYMTARSAYFSGMFNTTEVQLRRVSVAWLAQRESGHPAGTAIEGLKDFRFFPRYEDLDQGYRALFAPTDLEPGNAYRYEIGGSGGEPVRNVFVMRMMGDAGGEVYTVFEPGPAPTPLSLRTQGRLLETALTVAISVLLCGIVFYFLLDRGSRRLGALSRWAAGLNATTAFDEAPDFAFEEVNKLAQTLQSSFVTVARSVERERAFSRFASHELRSPLAVLTANLDILETRTASESAPPDPALLRMRRAVDQVVSLTQALLWLARNEAGQAAREAVVLTEICRRLAAENAYLAHGRAVTVEIEGVDSPVGVARIYCEIVLRNLIRNALQYTESGAVRILVDGRQVTVVNPVAEGESRGVAQADEHGFGIGLLLVESVAEKMRWKVESSRDGSGHRVSVEFA